MLRICFATALLFYCIVSLSLERRSGRLLLWYALVGVAVGFGILFKYNFAI